MLCGRLGLVAARVIRNEILPLILTQIAALIVLKPVIAAVLVGQGDVAAAVVEVLSARERHEALASVALIRNAELGADGHAFEIALEQEVDDP